MTELVQGIVLDSFKFKENSVVCKIFTLQHGMLSVLVNGIGKKNANANQIYLQPLSHLELVVYMKENHGILRSKDIRMLQTALGITPKVKSYAIACFVAEIVLRTYKEHEIDHRLYDLLCHVVQHIENQEVGVQDLHLFFLCRYSELLGFLLQTEELAQIDELEAAISRALSHLLQMQQYTPLGITKQERRGVVRFVLRYLSHHIELPTIKSLEILEEVLS
jgi:DNA repair protein RecO (recombination protein O)